MRVSRDWLREYTDVPADATARDIAATLVRVGLEEEDFVDAGVTGPVVVGRVETLEEETHSNGKTIRWCQVRVGAGDGDVRGIVCGAANVAEGDRVVVALPGAVLPGGFAISARKTYGHVSDGMICSQHELGLGDDHDGIIVLEQLGLTAEPGDDAISLLTLDDPVLDVNVTPDRGYCFSVRGLAREYALSAGVAYRDPAALDVAPAGGDGWPVDLRDDSPLRGVPGCDRYVARSVRGVDPSAPTPFWMQRRLQQAGMRPISLAVDVTNYVMLTTGQPLHAFDLADLRGPIVVRRAAAGERLVTLDGVERRLHPEDLLITDEDDRGGSRVIAIAGLMGGADTEVGSGTSDVLIEAAHFAQVSVARSSRRHKLVSEAGRRFERGVDPALAPAAAELAVRLLVEYGGGSADPAVTDVDRRPPATVIEFDPAAVAGLVGTSPGADRTAEILAALGCRLARGANGLLEVTVPSWRPDLGRGVDLVEEVARVHGYDHIPSVLPAAPAGRGLTGAQRRTRLVGDVLAGAGWTEVISYPFTSSSVHDGYGLAADDPRRVAVRLVNPMSDELPLVRTMVLDTLLSTLRRNLGRGERDLALFEIGMVARPAGHTVPALPHLEVGEHPDAEQRQALLAAVPPQPRRLALAATGEFTHHGWWGEGGAADWSAVIGAARLVAARLHVPVRVVRDADHLPWHPGRCGRIERADGTLVGHAGELHPRAVRALELPERTVAAEIDLDALLAAAPDRIPAEPLSTFPPVHQDVAVQVGEDVAADDVRQALVDGAGDLLESIGLFDVYRGGAVPEGAKSLAFRLTFRAPDRTLTDQEVSGIRAQAVATAAARTGAVSR